MVVGFAPGGPADVVARLIAPALGADLGQPVVVENASGAGGAIGQGRVAAARPDRLHHPVRQPGPGDDPDAAAAAQLRPAGAGGDRAGERGADGDHRPARLPGGESAGAGGGDPAGGAWAEPRQCGGGLDQPSVQPAADRLGGGAGDPGALPGQWAGHERPDGGDARSRLRPDDEQCGADPRRDDPRLCHHHAGAGAGPAGGADHGRGRAAGDADVGLEPAVRPGGDAGAGGGAAEPGAAGGAGGSGGGAADRRPRQRARQRGRTTPAGAQAFWRAEIDRWKPLLEGQAAD